MFSRTVLIVCVLCSVALLAETKSIRRKIARRSSLRNKHWHPHFHRSPLIEEEPSDNDSDTNLYAYNKPALQSAIEGRNKFILAEEDPITEGRNKILFPESESSLESPHKTASPVIAFRGVETNENDARIRELMQELVIKSRFGEAPRPVIMMQKTTITESALTPKIDESQPIDPLIMMQKTTSTESGLTPKRDETLLIDPVLPETGMKKDIAEGTEALDAFLDEALEFFQSHGKEDDKEDTTLIKPSQLSMPQKVVANTVIESDEVTEGDNPMAAEVFSTTSTIPPEPMITEQYDSIEKSQIPVTMQDNFETSTVPSQDTTTEQYEAVESTTQSPLEKINDSRVEIIDDAIKRIMNSFETTTEQNEYPIEETSTTWGGQLLRSEITPPTTEETSTLQHTSTTEVNDGMTTSTEMPLAGGDPPNIPSTTMTVRVLDAIEGPLYEANKPTVEDTTAATDVNIRVEEEITSQSPWLTEVIENNATTTSAPIEGMHEMGDMDERFEGVTTNGSATTDSLLPEAEGKVEVASSSTSNASASGSMQEIEIKFENMLKSEIESFADKPDESLAAAATMSGGQDEDGNAAATTQLSKLLHEDVSSTINCFTVVSLPAHQMNEAGNGAPSEQEQAATVEEIIKKAKENTSINTAVGHNTNNNNTNWPASNDMNVKSKCPPTTTTTKMTTTDGPTTIDGEASPTTTTETITTATDNRTQMPSIEKEMTDIYKGNNQELHDEDDEGTNDDDDDDEEQQDDDASDASDYESDDDDESDEANVGDEVDSGEAGQHGERMESEENRDEIGGVPVAYLPSNQANIVYNADEPAMPFMTTENMKQSEDKHETTNQDNRNEIKTFTTLSAAGQTTTEGQLNDTSHREGDANADDDVAASKDGNPYESDTTPYHSPNEGTADDHSTTAASGVVAGATDATRTNWWSSVTYEEIRNFLNTIFDSATNELYEEIARKSKEMRKRTTGNGPTQRDRHSKLNTLWSLW